MFLPYLFKKDLLLLKGSMIIWGFVVLLHTVLQIYAVDLSYEHLNRFTMVSAETLTKLVYFLQCIMVLKIIPFLIHEDPLVGTTAFWYTRPISRRSLFVTKSCFVLLFLVLFPLAGEIFVFLWNGFSFHSVFLLIPEVIIERTVFIVPFFLLASVTPKLSTYLFYVSTIAVAYVTMQIIFFAFGNYSPWLSDLKGLLFYQGASTYSLRLSRTVIKNIVLILFGFSLLYYQYTTRKTEKAVFFIGIAAIIYFGIIPRIWNKDFITVISDRLKQKPLIKTGKQINITMDKVILLAQLSDGTSQYEKNKGRLKTLGASFHIDGLLPGQFAMIKTLKHAEIIYPDGSIIRSPSFSPFLVWNFADEMFMKPLQELFKGYTIVDPYEERSIINIFSAEKTDLLKYAEKEGTYKAYGEFDIYTFQIEAAVSLIKGSIHMAETRQLGIYDIVPDEKKINIVTEEWKSYLLFERSTEKKSFISRMEEIRSGFKEFYIIRNKRLNKIFLPDLGLSFLNFQVTFPFLSPSHLSGKAGRYIFLTEKEHSSSQTPDKWLKGAELFRIQAKKVGQISTWIKHKGFVIPPSK